MAMSNKQFKDEFNDLMARAMDPTNGSPPYAQAMVELQLALTKVTNIQITVRADAEAREAMKGIIGVGADGTPKGPLIV